MHADWLSCDGSAQQQPPFRWRRAARRQPANMMNHDMIAPKRVIAASTAVAVDRDKNSQFAVRWAVENLRLKEKMIILVHVATSHQEKEDCEGRSSDMQQLFLPYRGFCARKGVRTKEVVLHDLDIAVALCDFISAHSLKNIILGASSRSAITRAFKNGDVATSVGKLAPDTCSVYSVSRGKANKIKSSSDPISPVTALPPHVSLGFHRPGSLENSSTEYEQSSPSERSVASSAPSPPYSTTSSNESRHLFVWEKCHGSSYATCSDSTNTSFVSSHNTPSIRPPHHYSYQSEQHSYPSEIYYELRDEPRISDASRCFSSTLATEIEDELNRVKLELKHITDKYNAACLEVVTARDQEKEITQWRRNKVDDKHTEEFAMIMVEHEKQNSKAAMEIARKARVLADLETEKRKRAEKKFKIEAKQKQQVLDALAHGLARCRRYSIDEIEEATNNFTSNKLGEGSYGPVYKATIDHTPVAIKILKSEIPDGLKQFQQEVEVLSRMRHPNMVILMGACPDNGCLVYEYMDNGCLDDRLLCKDETPPLPWTTRFTIAAEIATGLNFLHQTKPQPIVHRDLKPANILLDKNFVSKISDVGLCRLVPASIADEVTQYRMTAAAGTFCYIDPEYQQTGLLGTKSDVYSLGIILLQLITARPAMGLTHQVKTAIEMGRFVEILDQRVKDWPLEETLSFAKLALHCSELRRRDRPNLHSTVLPELVRLRDAALQLKPEKKSYYFTYSNHPSYSESLSSYEEMNNIYALLWDDRSGNKCVESSSS